MVKRIGAKWRNQSLIHRRERNGTFGVRWQAQCDTALDLLSDELQFAVGLTAAREATKLKEALNKYVRCVASI